MGWAIRLPDISVTIGLLQIECTIPGSRSLKDKRRVTKSIKDRLANRHNVSVSEIGDLEHRQAATLGIAMIANESRFVESTLAKIADELGRDPRASMLDHSIEIW